MNEIRIYVKSIVDRNISKCNKCQSHLPALLFQLIQPVSSKAYAVNDRWSVKNTTVFKSHYLLIMFRKESHRQFYVS